MIKKLPLVLLAITCVALAVALQSQRKQNARLAGKIADMEAGLHEPAETGSSAAAERDHTEHAQATMEEDAAALEGGPATVSESEEENTKRVMRDMAKTIEENPTINKMVEMSQRGAMGALYGDMIEYLGLDAEETEYFMELLMYRQMAHVDAHMKMMSGSLTDEEQQALQDKLGQVSETMRAEMENFLNDQEDFEEFEYYEETIGERMVLSQMDQQLGEAALPDETYRDVLAIMYEERSSYNWSTDLHDSEIRDLSPERFSQENIQKHIADMRAVGELMDMRMQEILTPEQLAAWRDSGLAMQALVEGQLIQANQMYSDE
jgi:hypothetical protein